MWKSSNLGTRKLCWVAVCVSMAGGSVAESECCAVLWTMGEKDGGRGNCSLTVA